jgi:hypothetical protein
MAGTCAIRRGWPRDPARWRTDRHLPQIEHHFARVSPVSGHISNKSLAVHYGYLSNFPADYYSLDIQARTTMGGQRARIEVRRADVEVNHA